MSRPSGDGTYQVEPRSGETRRIPDSAQVNSSRMKVLIYTHAFAPQVGGVETLVLILAQGLAESFKQWGREDVTVVTSASAEGVNDSKLTFRLVRRPNPLTLWYLVGSTDVLHLAGPALLPLILGLLRRKPIVVEHHGFQTACPNGQLFYESLQNICPGHFMSGRHRECLRCTRSRGRPSSFKMWLLTFLRRWLCCRVSANIVPTSWLANVLQLPNTTVIHHGIAGDRAKKAYLAPFHEPLTFAFMGRLVRTKGIHIVLQAASRLKAINISFRLRIIGDGPEREILEGQVKDLNLADCVTFLGRLTLADLPPALDDVVAIITPSLAGEVFGLVLLEQMQEGRVQIVSALGPLNEVVGNAGMKFSPGNSNELARCMRRIILTPSLIKDLGERAHLRARESFKLEDMVQKHLAIYRFSLMNGRRRPTRA